MATRFQIMKKTSEGIFRTSTNTVEAVEEIVNEAQNDAKTIWIVVKDRQRRLRQQIWRRSEGVVIEPWWRQE